MFWTFFIDNILKELCDKQRILKIDQLFVNFLIYAKHYINIVEQT